MLTIMSLMAGLGAQVFDMTATSLAYISLDEICEMRSQHKEGNGVKLGQLITFGRGREATDVRDRAYDVFGLTKVASETTLSFSWEYRFPSQYARTTTIN
jgi:hypothetical protein